VIDFEEARGKTCVFCQNQSVAMLNLLAQSLPNYSTLEITLDIKSALKVC